MLSVSIKGLISLAQLEPYGKIALSFSKDGFDLSESQRQHIQYTGACTVNSILSGDIYEALRKGPYGSCGVFTDVAAFKKAMQSQPPSYAQLLDQFDKEGLFSITLTSVGQAIAIANISNFLGKLDYSIWLK